MKKILILKSFPFFFKDRQLKNFKLLYIKIINNKKSSQSGPRTTLVLRWHRPYPDMVCSKSTSTVPLSKQRKNLI